MLLIWLSSVTSNKQQNCQVEVRNILHRTQSILKPNTLTSQSRWSCSPSSQDFFCSVVVIQVAPHVSGSILIAILEGKSGIPWVEFLSGIHSWALQAFKDSTDKTCFLRGPLPPQAQFWKCLLPFPEPKSLLQPHC